MDLVTAGRTPSQVLSPGSFRNAIVALAAIGGSTNAVVHLLAIAGRAGIPLSLDDFDTLGSSVPLLVDLAPAGRYLMDDLYRAGGLLAVLREVSDLLDPDALTVSGRPLAAHLGEARIWDETVIRPRSAPLQEKAGIAVLRGSLARRRGDQARRRDQGTARPPGPGGGVRQHRGHAGPAGRPGPGR